MRALLRACLEFLPTCFKGKACSLFYVQAFWLSDLFFMISLQRCWFLIFDDWFWFWSWTLLLVLVLGVGSDSGSEFGSCVSGRRLVVVSSSGGLFLLTFVRAMLRHRLRRVRACRRCRPSVILLGLTCFEKSIRKSQSIIIDGTTPHLRLGVRTHSLVSI